ncbi:iron-containing alcohol dehydrogenase [Glaciecola siphonariae]|uniref:Iron-containing alcohol dehydrogenase n=1 Tax=Glaciecola siphonariae TaxID=521012 RepID=A0ABV9LY64_9ALTE
MHAFEFNTTKRIVCEQGALAHIQAHCAQLGIKRPLVLTDPGIEKCGLLGRLRSYLSSSNASHGHSASFDSCIVYSKVEADPDERIMREATALALKENADGIIGFGGGSAMDTAKVVSVLATEKQNLSALYGVEQITAPRLPLILIPTTAGTGSEVTPIAIVTTSKSTKSGIVSHVLLPDIAVLDAELTVDLPEHISAATGIDAMVHAIEAYTGKHKKNLYSDMLAKQALRLLSQNIETATFNGGDLGARQNMLLGACLAGQAFANSPVAAVHALAYPLGGHFHIPHGLSNALVLPHVLRFNEQVAYPLYSELSPCIIKGVCTEQDSMVLSRLFIAHIESLISHLKLPNKLHMLGIEKKDLPMLAKDAMQQTRLLVNNPRALNYEDALGIYQQAY